jgi:hypothetical protein
MSKFHTSYAYQYYITSGNEVICPIICCFDGHYSYHTYAKKKKKTAYHVISDEHSGGRIQNTNALRPFIKYIWKYIPLNTDSLVQ